ncbi:FixH family protein [Zhouia sp. PK063]|uniref:FixH family protein n=1 Tax=Zhouia sp. PK063 TaxID=3373602 RepID=UPI003799B468
MKLKFNWGTSIVIAFICFISFIMYFVINMNINKKYDHDLVTENYYKKELAFQNEINTEEKTIRDGMTTSVKKTNEGLEIIFPKGLSYKNINGKVFLYRPSSKQLDFEMPISVSTSKLLIPNAKLLGGRWNIEIQWNYQKNKYLSKQEVTY